MSTAVPERVEQPHREPAPCYVPDRALLLEEGAIRSLMELRRDRGLDRRDEVWEGVLHMVPPANEAHGTTSSALSFATFPAAQRRGGRIVTALGLRAPGSGERNYRVPDLVYVAPEDLPRLGKVYLEGGAAVVFEILSENDDTYKKFDFYASLGVREVVIVEPGEPRAEVYRLAGDRFLAVAADSDGRTPIQALGVRFERRLESGAQALFLRDDATGVEARIA